MGYSAKQRKVKVGVEGAERLAKDLKAMDDAAAGVLMTGAEAGGKIALADAQLHCPVDSGALKASLKIAEDKKTAIKATVKIDYDKSLKYGTHVELGARGRPANPFMRNAVDNNQRQINEAIVSAVSKAVGRKM